MSNRGLRWLILSIAIVGYVMDQVTKWAAETNLDPTDPPKLLGGFLTLQLAYNPGAAFSLGTKFTVGLSIISIIAALVCVWLSFRVKERKYAIILGMVLAGILGNVTDRLFRAPGPMRGHVVDFIQLPYFAIFNVADMFITVAAALTIFFGFVAKDDEQVNATTEKATN